MVTTSESGEESVVANQRGDADFLYDTLRRRYPPTCPPTSHASVADLLAQIDRPRSVSDLLDRLRAVSNGRDYGWSVTCVGSRQAWRIDTTPDKGLRLLKMCGASVPRGLTQALVGPSTRMVFVELGDGAPIEVGLTVEMDLVGADRHTSHAGYVFSNEGPEMRRQSHAYRHAPECASLLPAVRNSIHYTEHLDRSGWRELLGESESAVLEHEIRRDALVLIGIEPRHLALLGEADDWVVSREYLVNAIRRDFSHLSIDLRISFGSSGHGGSSRISIGLSGVL